MTPEEILRVPANRLTEAQRRHYFDQGFVLIENVLHETLLNSLKQALVRVSNAADEDDEDFEFETLAESNAKSLRQVLRSADHDSVFWDFARKPPLIDMVADLVGPNVKYFQTNVSFKPPGGRGFPWHQDYAFIPSSNLSPLMAFAFIEDVTQDMGPTVLVPGSHLDSPYDHYDESGNWLGVIGEHDIGRLASETARSMCGPAGSVLLVNCATVHRADANTSACERPMVISGYMSADSYCYVDSPYESPYNWQILRGQAADYVDSSGPRMKLPPNWKSHEGVRIDDLSHHRDA